jgi:hypothetical protein
MLGQNVSGLPLISCIISTFGGHLRETRRSLNADISACFTQPQGFITYEGRMRLFFSSQPPPRAAMVAALLALGLGLSGCAGMSDSMTLAFADPAKYNLYECKQLEAERKNLAVRAAELQGLMAKAETGVVGSAVAEIAYRNDYVKVRGQTKLVEDAWRSNKCHDSPPSTEASGPTPTSLANTKSRRPAASSGSASSGSAVY